MFHFVVLVFLCTIPNSHATATVSPTKPPAPAASKPAAPAAPKPAAPAAPKPATPAAPKPAAPATPKPAAPAAPKPADPPAPKSPAPAAPGSATPSASATTVASKAAAAAAPPVKFAEQEAIHDTEHIKQHMEEQIDISRLRMDQDAEIFYYFRMHDLNRDGRLDGIELIKGLTHVHEGINDVKTLQMSDDQLEMMVNAALAKMDTDDDGFITYPEYKSAVQS